MNAKKLKKARLLKAKGWSLRDIASDIGMSHESVRVALGELPPHMAPPKPRPAKRSRPSPTSGTLLDVCRALLAELRARAKSTSHPTLKTRYASDSTTLAGLVLRLEADAATRTEGIAVTRAELEKAHTDLNRRIREHIAKLGPLRCAGCGVPLEVTPITDEPLIPEGLLEPAAAASSVDSMITEARAALGWILKTTDDHEAVGDEVSTQRAGRAAVSIAGFVARLEKAILKSRGDLIHISPAEIAKAEAMIDANVRGLAARGAPRCSSCSRRLSISQGLGIPESAVDDFDAADGGQ